MKGWKFDRICILCYPFGLVFCPSPLKDSHNPMKVQVSNFFSTELIRVPPRRISTVLYPNVKLIFSSFLGSLWNFFVTLTNSLNDLNLGFMTKEPYFCICDGKIWRLLLLKLFSSFQENSWSDLNFNYFEDFWNSLISCRIVLNLGFALPIH